MEYSFKNPILEDLDLDLVFDIPNIKNETFGEILEIIKYCSSLVNHDIISIAEELDYRMQEKLIEVSPTNIKTIQNRSNTANIFEWVHNIIIIFKQNLNINP